MHADSKHKKEAEKHIVSAGHRDLKKSSTSLRGSHSQPVEYWGPFSADSLRQDTALRGHRKGALWTGPAAKERLKKES